MQATDPFRRVAPEILVFEREPRWTPELQRQLQGQKMRVGGCRSVSAFWQPPEPAVALMELAADPAGVLSVLLRLGRESRDVDCIVIAAEEFADWEWRLRELGATTVVSTEISGSDLAHLPPANDARFSEECCWPEPVTL